MKAVLYYVFAFILGAVASYGFAPYYQWWATLISIAIAYHFIRGFFSGFLFGSAYGIFTISWTVPSLKAIWVTHDFFVQDWWFYPVVWGVVAICFGLVLGVAFWMFNLATLPTRPVDTGQIGWRRVLYFAVAWSAASWFSEYTIMALPWARVSGIFIDWQIAQMMAYIGSLGLTFLIVGSVAAVSEFIKSRSKWGFLFFIPFLFAPLIPKTVGETDFRVRIVQPAFPESQKYKSEYFNLISSAMLNLSMLSGLDNIDLVIWPEASWPYNANDWTVFPALGKPLVVGSKFHTDGKIYNALLYADEKGFITDRYFKFKLVPFGESRPLGNLFPGYLEWGPGPMVIKNFAPAICFEIIFSSVLVPVGQRPDFILNISNDSWLQNGNGIFQYLDLMRRQAIESGLPVVRANYAGPSTIIDANGSVIKESSVGRGIMDANIPVARMTLYRYIGINGIMICILLLSGLVLLMFNRPRNQA